MLKREKFIKYTILSIVMAGTLIVNSGQALSVMAETAADNTTTVETTAVTETPAVSGYLEVVGTFPSDGDVKVPVNSPIFIEFDKGITIKDDTLIKVSSDTETYDVKAEVIDDNDDTTEDTTLVLYSMDSTLKYDTTYHVEIAEGAIQSSDAALTNNKISLSFETGAEFTRLYGSTRYETSVKISQEGWDQSDYVVLATGKDYPDALCAAPLAANYGAPILLTEPSALSASTEAEIDRLKAKEVIIIGGTGAVSADIENKLKSKGLTIKRLAGKTRYETSIAIANELGNVTTAVIATGNNFPDALSVAASAATYGMPILLTDNSNIPAAVTQYIKDNGIENTIVIGGKGIISDAAMQKFPNAERLGGANRYETNMQVIKYFNEELPYAVFATGQNFPDALSASAMAAWFMAPILLVDDGMPAASITSLSQYKSGMYQKYIIGGPTVVKDSLISKVTK